MPDLSKLHVIDKPTKPDAEGTSARCFAYSMPQSAMQSPAPAVPSLYYLKLPVMAEMAMVGRLAAVMEEQDHYVGVFMLPTAHPAEPSEGETLMPSQLALTPEVVDTFVNSGALVALDNLVFGVSNGGVLTEVNIFIVVEG